MRHKYHRLYQQFVAGKLLACRMWKFPLKKHLYTTPRSRPLCSENRHDINPLILSCLTENFRTNVSNRGKGKVVPYSLPSVRPGADPGVQAVSPQVTWSESRHKPGRNYRLPLLSATLQGYYQLICSNSIFEICCGFVAQQIHNKCTSGIWLIPLGDGSTWVWAACSRLLPDSATAENWTHDHWVL